MIQRFNQSFGGVVELVEFYLRLNRFLDAQHVNNKTIFNPQLHERRSR